MIKVQPARSRVEKEETPDRIVLTLPAKGWGSLGGLLALGALLWVGGALAWGVWAWTASALEWAIVAGVIALPGTWMGLAALASCRSSWTLERSAETLRYTLRRPWGISLRSWPARDISSLWVEEATVAGELRSILTIGFRNGRSVELMHGTQPEELRWLAAVLSDPRGSRPTSDQPALAAEPVRHRADPAVVPRTLAVSRGAGGTELAFLPLIKVRARGVGLLAGSVVGIAAVFGLPRLLRSLGLESWAGLAAQAAGLLLLAALLFQLWTLSRSASVEVRGDDARIIQRPFGATLEFKVADLEFVQTLGSGRRTELQFLIRGRPKIRLFQGRPPDELEWAARYLRVALRGRPVEETRPLQVDAAAGDCRVCGEKMDRRVIYCSKCRTPHHEECWSYVGQCSTYGCREIGFTRS